jgi:hypothetical protein
MTATERKLRAEWRRFRAEHSDRLAGCSFDVSKRMTSKLGVCQSSRATGLPVRVAVAAGLMAPGLEDQAMDTFLHEVAHALAGHKAGHGPEWKAMCRKLGACPERLARLDESERMTLAKARPAPKWRLRCHGCGVTDTRNRVSRHMQWGGAICGRCGGRVEFMPNR